MAQKKDKRTKNNLQAFT